RADQHPGAAGGRAVHGPVAPRFTSLLAKKRNTFLTGHHAFAPSGGDSSRPSRQDGTAAGGKPRKVVNRRGFPNLVASFGTLFHSAAIPDSLPGPDAVQGRGAVLPRRPGPTGSWPWGRNSSPQSSEPGGSRAAGATGGQADEEPEGPGQAPS